MLLTPDPGMLHRIPPATTQRVARLRRLGLAIAIEAALVAVDIVTPGSAFAARRR